MAVKEVIDHIGFDSYRVRKNGTWSSKTPYTETYTFFDIAPGDAIAVFLKELSAGDINQVANYISKKEHPDSINASFCKGDPYSGEPIVYSTKQSALSDSDRWIYFSGFTISNTQDKTGFYLLYENNRNAELKDLFLHTSVSVYTSGDDSKPTAPVAESPSGGEVNGYSSIRFSWKKGTSGNYPIKSNVVHISKNGNTSIDAPVVYSDTSYYDYPEKRLKELGSESFSDGDTVYWRVGAKTLFSDYVFSDWLSTAVRFKTPVLTQTTPVNESKRGNTAITFRWNATEATPSSVELQYSYNGTSWVTYSGTKYSTYATIPSKYFNIGTVYWRVRAKNSYGDWGEWSDAVSFTVAEALPSTTAKTVGYFKRADPSVLSWSSSSDYGTVNGAEVEYYDDQNDTWVSLGSVSGTVREITVPGNTFPLADSIRWHVRSFNGAHEPGAWSENAIATIDRITSATPASPINGASRNEKQSITFQWITTNDLSSAPTGADLQYRYADDEWKTFGHVDGSEKEFTADPDLFIGAIVYWRVRAYNQDGVAGGWSSEAKFTTVDAPSVSAPQSPIGTIEDTDSELTFTWTTSSTSGSEPTGADVQYSYDGSTWETLGHTDGTRSLTVEGGTIHAGTVQWRVRSYNRNGTAGAWSSPATFVAHAAPRILDILADGKPFTTITWQATDQENYHIIIDDTITIGPVFSDDKSYQLSDYLEDGLHTVKLRVQNSMSIWSEWSEVTFNVVNVPGDEIFLQGISNADTLLSWDDAFGGPYMIYRDGKLIGESGKKAFTDRVILGEHNYHVIRRLDDGYYSISNIYAGVMSTKVTLMAPLTGGEWTPLQKSENAKRTERFTRKRAVAYHHFSGNKFPTPEVGEQEELIGEYDVAWMYTEEGARVLDSLIGQAIIIKSRGNEVMIGVFEGYTKVNRKQFHGFSFNLTQMDWEDYVCEE